MCLSMSSSEKKQKWIRNNIARFRADCGLSRADLAELSGIPEKNLVRYENGETNVSSTAIVELAHVFGRDEGDFYKENPPPAPELEQLPKLFLKQWPGYQVPADVLEEVCGVIERANEKLRGMKLPKK